MTDYAESMGVRLDPVPEGVAAHAHRAPLRHARKPSPQSSTAENRSNFQRFVRPVTGRLLHCLRLDVEYDFGAGDTLEYVDERGQRVRVYDFLGGYGALIFGHNHSQLIETAVDILRSGRPFAVQGSLRVYTARLGRKLNDMLSARFGREFVTTLANSGAEAVEAALKHAQLAYRKRKRRILDTLDAKLLKLRSRHALDRYPVAPASIRLLGELLPGEKIVNFAQAVAATRRLNSERFLNAPAVYCCLKKSYHGKTAGAVNLTENEMYRADFVSIGPKAVFVDRADSADFLHQARSRNLHYYSVSLDENRQAVVETQGFCNIAALFVEPIQGEGGIHVLTSGYLADLRRICDEHGIHLVFDEIQSGMGRTGRFLCSEASGVTADYYLMSKSLGGGLAKISSVSIDKRLFEEDFSMIHTSTFAEDDFSSALALRSLELLDEDPGIMRNCAEIGREVKDALLALKQKYPGVVKDVRGEGLMLAIEFADQNEAESAGLLTLAGSDIIGYVYAGYLLYEYRIRVAPLLSNNNVLRLEPGACIGEPARKQLYVALDRLCCILQRQNFYELVKFVIGLETPGAHGRIKDYRGAYFATPQEEDADRTIGFLMHFVDVSGMRDYDRSCENFTPEQTEALLERCYLHLDSFYLRTHTVYSKTGKRIRFKAIGMALTSALIQKHLQARDKDTLVAKVEEAIDKAVAAGCEILGFGGFTSIIMQNCKAVRERSLAVTTGNSLTIGMGYEALLRAAADAGVDLATARFAAVGANGNIGSVYCELMAEKVAELILIGRPGRESALKALAARLYAGAFEALLSFQASSGARLSDIHALAARIYDTLTVRALLSEWQGTGAGAARRRDAQEAGRRIYQGLEQEWGEGSPIRISTDPAAVSRANLILGASSQAESVIFPEHLGDGPGVICDVALPADTDPSVSVQRPDVTVIKGGLVRMPPAPPEVTRRNAHLGARHFMIEGIPIPADHVFACMCETMLMGLTGITSDYSKGDVRREQVLETLGLAKLHGFELGDLKTGHSF